jgi:hypothetical protein
MLFLHFSRCYTSPSSRLILLLFSLSVQQVAQKRLAPDCDGLRGWILRTDVM